MTRSTTYFVVSAEATFVRSWRPPSGGPLSQETFARCSVAGQRIPSPVGPVVPRWIRWGYYSLLWWMPSSPSRRRTNTSRSGGWSCGSAPAAFRLSRRCKYCICFANFSFVSLIARVSQEGKLAPTPYNGLCYFITINETPGKRHLCLFSMVRYHTQKKYHYQEEFSY